MNHCDAYLFSDIDAGGAWWPDPEFTDWEDGWDALEWNNSGIDTVTQIQTRLMSQQYESLIRKTKFGR